MIIGSIIVEAMIYEAQSLKEKRSVTKSISTRVRQRFNVSISETNYQDVWQRTEWTIVSVSTDKKQVEKEIQRAISIIEANEHIEITNIIWDWL